MWNYERRLQFPVKILRPDPKAAQVIITQFGGPDGSERGKAESLDADKCGCKWGESIGKGDGQRSSRQ